MTIDLPPTRAEFVATYDSRATVRDWSGAVNSWWNNAGNWIPNGVPQTGDHVQQYLGTSMYNAGTLTLDKFYAGGSPGTVTHQLEDALTVNTFALGINGTAADYRFGGSNTRLTTGATYVGANGVGSINVNSGTWAAGQFLSIGDAASARGRIFLAGGRVSTPELDTGYYGRGTLEMHGGELFVGSFFAAGFIAGSAGTIEVHGGTLLSPIGVVGLTGNGTLIQSAGNVQMTQWFDLGEDAEATGYYHLSGGTFFSPEFAVGFLGKGQFVQTGGTATVGPLYVGPFGDATVSGGTLSTTILDIDAGGRLNIDRHEVVVADTGNMRQYVLDGKVVADGAVGFSTDLIRATLLGDANLDRTVNVSDSAILGTNFGSTSRNWYQGDFNYDGIVNIGDYSLLAANWGQSYTRTQAVPEPAGLALAGLLLWRRRADLIRLPVPWKAAASADEIKGNRRADAVREA